MSTAFIVGIVAGLVVAVLIFKVANKDGRVKTQYDERQEKIRGRGYMYAFYTMAMYEAVMIVFSSAGDIPVADYIIYMGGIFVGLIVQVTYCIWNDGYWGINNDRRRYLIVFLVCGLVNFIPVIGQAKSGELFRDGRFVGFASLNLITLVLMLFVVAELLLKGIADKRSEEGEL